MSSKPSRIPGMEGPIPFPGGRWLYWDPQEGCYYDRSTDMYLSDAEADRVLLTKNPTVYGVPASQIDPSKYYSVWQRVGGHWLIERSYPGRFILDTLMGDIEKSQSTSRPFAVFAKGTDPNDIRENPQGVMERLSIYDPTTRGEREVSGYHVGRSWYYEDGTPIETGGVEVMQIKGYRDNPTKAFTAKGKRMERAVAKSGVKAAPAVVYAAAKRGTPGLVKKQWAKAHGYPVGNPAIIEYKGLSEPSNREVIAYLTEELGVDPGESKRFAKDMQAAESGRRTPYAVLADLNNAVDGGYGAHGVEGIYEEYGGKLTNRSVDQLRPVAEYVNTGDTYSPTVIFDYEKGMFYLTTWGDWVERYEMEHAIE